MSLGSALEGTFSRWGDRFMQRFADLPDAGLSADQAAREYLVKDAGSSQADHYFRSDNRDPLETADGKPFDMVATVAGGLHEGDIVLTSLTAENA